MAHDTSGFDDIFFPIRVSFGLDGGESLETLIHVTKGGREYRNEPTDDVRNEFDGEAKNFTFEEADKVTAFVRARGVQTFAFRWKDWTDFTAVDAPALPQADGVRDTFNMYKRYSDLIEDQDRRIALLVDPSRTEWGFTGGEDAAHGPIITPLVIKVNDVPRPDTEYTIDYRNGRVIFNPGSEPGNGFDVTWTGEYHNAVRLGQKRLSKTLVSAAHITFNQLKFIEVLAWDILETADA